MTDLRHIAVIDIGKTNAKLALVDLQSLTEVAVVTRPNLVQPGPPWPHYDVEGHWEFLLTALAQFHKDHRVDAISITTHGACAALLDHDGQLAAPILDYEHTYSAEAVAQYDAIKPNFADTGSPKLAGGLNIGAQLHWQFSTDPTLKDRTAHIVTYPQYWGHRLTGEVATDVTSIGCHTDLWSPQEAGFSELPDRLDITDKIAQVRNPADILGQILPQVTHATGLALDTPVCVGIHDSNASLYPYIMHKDAPLSVVSTGTWVVAMALNGDVSPQLDQTRDTLVNVNAHGQPVPSARFMGGREFEMIQQGHSANPSPTDVAAVLDASLMILPAVEPNTGPFQGQTMRWVGQEPVIGSGERSAALSFYLAMMTDTCLRLIGGQGPTVIEGPFAQNPVFTAMLGAATHRPVLVNDTVTGTSIGAALLFGKDHWLPEPVQQHATFGTDKLRAYAERWRRTVNLG